MKTALVSACFLEGNDPIGNDRLLRNLRYLNYYSNIQEEIGFDKIILFDNASSEEKISIIENFQPHVQVIRFHERLVRGPGPNEYPYCWRALYEIKRVIEQGYEKIVAIDSDGFVLNSKLAHFIRDCNSGCVSFLCRTWNFPESSIFILNKDSFPIFLEYTKTPWQERVGQLMEVSLPFTQVRTEFNCERFGEIGRPAQDDSMDYYGQAPLDVVLTYKKGPHN